MREINHNAEELTVACLGEGKKEEFFEKVHTTTIEIAIEAVGEIYSENSENPELDLPRSLAYMIYADVIVKMKEDYPNADIVLLNSMKELLNNFVAPVCFRTYDLLSVGVDLESIKSKFTSK